jgi:SSS family solute:Na+ symporter
VSGWEGLKQKLAPSFVHARSGLNSPQNNPLGVEWFSLIMGLGFVLSFGYWCTDFLVVQRATAADSMASARRTPLIAAVPKMLFPFLVMLPGLLALALTYPQNHSPNAQATSSSPASVTTANSASLIPPETNAATGQIVKDQNGEVVLNYNMVIPNMLLHYFPSGMLGIGLTALLASFMSGMAGNVTAFNTVWTCVHRTRVFLFMEGKRLPVDPSIESRYDECEYDYFAAAMIGGSSIR